MIGVVCYMKCLFECEDSFSPCDVSSFKWLVAVWAQLYFWLEIYLFYLAVVFGFLHKLLRLQLGIKMKAFALLFRLYVSYGLMVFFQS